MFEDMRIENKLRIARAANNYTQEQLADKIGVTRQTIIAIEKGAYNPSLFLGLKLAMVLDRDINEIFYLNDSENEK